MYLNLKKEMERNCVTIEDISRSLELHRNTVSNKLNGNTPLSVEEGIKIRNTFFEYIFIKGLGSEYRVTTAFKNKSEGVSVKCGCFLGTLQEFEDKVKETHGESKFAKEYLALVELIKIHFKTEETENEKN